MSAVQTRATRLAGALLVAGALLIAAPAAAQEYKLVLTPEPGQAPPARVCLLSRNRTMKADRAQGLTQSLADRVTCADRTCEAARDTRPVRCRSCPAEPHPGCRARVELGERALDDYSVVCADDDTAPPEGGTVYISVESVEAENPPRFYGFEVSGGRVRWSSFEPISRPSYRVLGGDFETSRFSYPRGASDEPWAEVPVRRRCRCLDTRVQLGVGAIESVRVDDAEVCRGEPSAEGLVPVEVPAVEQDRVAAMRVEASHASLGGRWSTRWPPVPIELAPRHFSFDWTIPCIWPRPDRCPVATIRGAACRSPGPADGRCRYDCQVIADGAVNPPLPVHLGLDDPDIQLSEILGAPGQALVGRVPADARVVWTDVSSWQRDVPGDRIRAIEVLAVDGTRMTIELTAEDTDRLTVPLPGARCGTSLRTELIGERSYAPGFGRIEPGGRLVVPDPTELVVPWDVHLSLGGGMMGVISTEDRNRTGSHLSWALVQTTGVRVRWPAERWFLHPRAAVLFVGGWPYHPITIEGTGETTKRHSYMAAALEVVTGRTGMVFTRPYHAYAGLGGGASFNLLGNTEVVEQGRPMGTLVLGFAAPLSNTLGAATEFSVDLRYWFGSRSRHFKTVFDGAVIDSAEPAHALLLTLSLGRKL